MTEPFILHRADGPRWVLRPPHDPYGDGFVNRVETELHDDGMSAATTATVDGPASGPEADTLPGFVRFLANDWRGWHGVRGWRSLEHELALDARHDGRGYVTIGVTLRRPVRAWEATSWSARSVFVLEAGEEMTRLAADLTYLLRP